MSSKKKAATKKASKSAAKTSNKAAENREYVEASPESTIGKALAFMRKEVKSEGGQAKLEHGFLKPLFERTAKKFKLSPTTCATQYGRHVRKAA